ncbi:MAG: S8 family serine peptidase, partial [Candidatus Zixiibacteriota bacterium]
FGAIASGNTGTNERFFPAGFDFSFVVGAGNSDGFVTSFSTFGSHVDIVAPGLDILSLRAAGTDMFAAGGEPGVRIIGPDSLYFLSDGTSMATPTVVGAAALLRSLRPDLTLDELEEALHLGATDIVDPYDQGDSLVGPDTVSGYGYLNIDASLALLTHGGLAIASPAHRQRYTTDVAVKAAAISGYTGSWQLDYSVGLDSDQWLPLASGASVPADSVLFVFTDSMPDGHIRLRLTDHFDSRAELGFVYVRHNRLEITGPDPGIEIQYNVPIFGRAYGPQYDSMALFFREENGPAVRLKDSQGEFFDSLLTDWTVSGEGVGEFTIYLFGYFGPDVLIDSVPVTVTSAFAAGWPVTVGGRGGISPACADLNNDGTNELIVPTFAGLYVFEPDGTPFEGFPVLPNKDVRCVPAVYDIDRDGMNEIICTSADGIHVFNHDGSHSPGWPREMYTGLIPFGYGYPNPTVTRLGAFEDSAIVIINKIGQILAYEFNGDPYFFSREGLFASFDARIANFQGFGGDNSPFVGSTDLDGDGQYEVVSSYTAPLPYEGLGIFDGRTGLPGLGLADPLVVNIRKVYGMALADLNGDDNPEIIVMGYDSAQIPHIWVKTNGLDDLPGWPVAIPSMEGWIGQYPIMADLDLDGVPEIMTTYFEFDVGALYIFRADGTSYLPRDGRPAGEAFTTTRTVGTPIAANLTGDDLPEIIFRAGHIFPGTGPEEVFILDNQARPLEGWPIVTPARPTSVLSSRMAPMVDDLDGDGLVELIMVSDGSQVLVWDFDASYDNGNNRAKFLQDNLNSAHWLSPRVSTDIDDDPNGLLPGKVRLAQNYPNPFNPATVISFSVPVRARVQLEVFNILGQRVISLIDRELKAGKHQASFDGGKFASGVYFYRLTVGEEVRTRKMLLIK